MKITKEQEKDLRGVLIENLYVHCNGCDEWCCPTDDDEGRLRKYAAAVLKEMKKVMEGWEK